MGKYGIRRENFSVRCPLLWGGTPNGVPADAFLTGQILFEGMRSYMNTLLIIAGVIAIVLLLVGGFNQALSFLLWVGIILLVLALIGWVLGRGRSRV